MASITPPLPGLTTTEMVVRTLKSSHHSYDERLAVAQWLWSNETLVFPQREEFILDWCISSMLRFASKKGASTVNTPCSDLGFWQFLLVIFKTGTALTTDELNGQDQQLLLRGTQRHRSNLLLSSISAPLLPLFTGVLRAANEQFDTDNNEETMTVLSKVLETAATCLKLLTTSLEEQFHPTLEHLADTILSALASWSLAVSNGISDGSEQMARPLYNMSLILLNEFAKLCRRQTNQRKVFMLMTDKLLAPLLDARYQHHQLYNKEASHSALITSIDSVLRRGLFHTDHLADFATVLKNMHTNKSTKSHGNNEGRDISSYQKALFNRLNELTKNEITSKQVNPILSVLLRFFIDESRRRQRSIMTNSGSGTEQSELLAKQLEFAFFADLYRISDASVSPLVDQLNTGYLLLRVLSDMQVYRASNESIYEQQREFFNNVTQKCVVHLDSHDAQDTQKALFDNFTVLLTLDYSILEPVIDRIIPKTLSPPQESQEAARHFITELLQLQAKSRQFDTFMQQLLMAIQSWSPCNESILLTMPLLTSEFTTILESQVRKVPMSQIVQTITSIRQALMDQHLLIANQEGKKRRKLNRDTNTSSQQQIPNSITQLLAILLSRIINALPEQVLVDQSTDTYGLQHELKELGRSYIVPILEQQSRNTDHCISATYAIVALHGALMASYHDYWRLYASIESLKQLSIKGSARLTLAWVNALLVWISHWKIEHPLVKGNDSVEFDDGIIQRLVQQAISIDNCPYTTNEIEAQLAAISTWDGRLISLSNNTGASAQWLLLFSDWFSLICGQINDQQLDGLLTFLIRITQTASIHFKNDHHQPFVNLLDQLLKKSWFFEQSRLRDVFLPLLIRQLSSWAQVLNNESSSLSSMANETIDLLTTASDTITLSNIVNRLWTKESLSMLATLSKPLNRAINTVKVVDFIHQVDVWMSLLHQLPMAWYQCSVRDMIIRSILLLDRLFVALKSLIADSSSSQLIVKNHLVCRRLLSMVLQHYPDSHASLLEQPYLLIWMSETAITRQPLTDNLLQPLEEEKMQQTTKTIISSSLKWQLRRLRHEDTALVIVNEFMQPLLDWIKVHLKQVTNDWQSKKTAKQNLIIKVSLNEQALMMAEIILRALSTLSNISMNDATRSTKHTESIQQMMHSFNDLLNTGHQLTRQLLVNLQQTSNTVICNDNQETVTFINRLHKTVDLFDAVLVGGRALTKCGYTVSIDISTIPIQDLMNVCRQCLIPLQQTNKPIPLEVQITSICTALRLLEMILTNQANTTTSDDSRPAILLDLICQVIELTPLTPSSGQVHVYSRLHTSLDSFYIALATFSGQLLRDPFQDWITCILQELNSVIAGRFTNNAMQADKRCWSILTILCVISDPDHDAVRQRLRRFTSQIFMHLSGVLQMTSSSRVILRSLQVMYQLCSYKLLALRQVDIIACLQALTTLTSTAIAQRISITETQQPALTWDDSRWLGLLFNADVLPDTPINNDNDYNNNDNASNIPSAAEAMFAAVYRILLDIARHQRTALLDVVPLFSVQVRGLLHCLRAPRPNATPEQMERFYAALPFPLVSRHAPLRVSCARWVARLLSALVDRGAIQAGQRDATASGNAAATTATSHYQRAIGKHAPYLLADWLAIESDAQSHLSAGARTALQPGIFALLDLCTEHERHHLQMVVNQAERARLKDIYRDYLAHHKYVGKA